VSFVGVQNLDAHECPDREVRLEKPGEKFDFLIASDAQHHLRKAFKHLFPSARCVGARRASTAFKTVKMVFMTGRVANVMSLSIFEKSILVI